MTTLLRFRPIVSCGHALLPTACGALQQFPLHRGLTFHPMAFHPDEPWRAICQIIPGTVESGGATPTFAASITADRLRLIANQMLEVADHLDIKPAKDPRK
ncbi:MAG: hypothetical protein RL490_125 [Pseudomonadota bacterium]|jgi:hypothetical protein